MDKEVLMTAEEIRVIEKQLLSLGAQNKKINILEWGSGGSTVYFTQFLNNKKISYFWLSIEYNKEWFDKVRNAVSSDLNTKLVLFDVGNTESRQRHTNMDAYINYPATLHKKFDLIIVDGRKRRRCLIETKNLLSPNGVVFLHDAFRKFYHCAFRYYPNSFLAQPNLWQGKKENLSFFQRLSIRAIDLIYFPITKIKNFIAKIYLKSSFFQNLKKSINMKIKAII